MSISKSQSSLSSLRTAILHHGLDRDLEGLAPIARWLGYKERTFQVKVQKMSFNAFELIDLFKRLEFTDEEIIKIMGRK